MLIERDYKLEGNIRTIEAEITVHIESLKKELDELLKSFKNDLKKIKKDMIE
jgi:hypothetical protein